MTNARKPKNNHTNRKSLRPLLLFCAGLFLVIAVSFFIKAIQVISKSTFDGNHRFTILTNKPPLYIVSFVPSKKAIVMAKIVLDKDAKNINTKKIGQFLKIPTDGHVWFSFQEKNDIDLELFSMLLHYDSLDTNLTLYDIFRLWWFAKLVPSHSTVKTQFTIKNNGVEETPALVKALSKFFSDQGILDEKLSIQIVNATGEVGFGARLAKMITNMGGNVIIVSTADEISNTSQISYYGEPSYTLARFEKLLSLPKNQMYILGIADIVITLGKNSLGKDIF